VMCVSCGGSPPPSSNAPPVPSAELGLHRPSAPAGGAVANDEPGTPAESPTATTAQGSDDTAAGRERRGNDAPQHDSPTFDRAAAAASIASINVAKCKTGGGPSGAGHVKITFNPSDGRASLVEADSAPFAGTSVGRCVETLFRAVHVRPFTGRPVVVGKSFLL